MKLKNFAVYYGFGKQEDLSKYDLLIVEPEGHNPDDLMVLREKGALILSYLSIVEVIPQSEMAKGLHQEDFLTQGEERICNREIGNYFGDLRSERWQELLLNHIDELICQRGYEGLFLDTIGNLERADILEHFGYELHEAYVRLLIEVRKRYPEILMIQNNGLNTVLTYSEGYIDGLCWENPPVGGFNARGWMKAVTKRIQLISRKKPNFMVLLLEENHRRKWGTSLYAKSHSWLHYVAERDYL